MICHRSWQPGYKSACFRNRITNAMKGIKGYIKICWGIMVICFFALYPKVSTAQSCGFQTTCVPPSDWANASWQMFYGTQKHTGRQAMRGNFSVGIYGKWGTGFPNYVTSQPAVGDIHNDGNIEVVVGDRTGKVYALRGTNGAVLWSRSIGSLSSGGVSSSPLIADINGDGNIEVVIGSNNGRLYALRGTNGSVLWFYSAGSAVASSPAVGDIDLDGNVEVVVGSSDGNVYALRGLVFHDGKWSIFLTRDRRHK